MRSFSRTALSFSALVAGVAAFDANALPLDGFSTALYPALGSFASADWSSDFGVDYSVRPNGDIVGNGSVSNGSWVAPGGSYVVPNASYSATVSRPGFLGGDVSGTIGVDIGSYGAIGADVVHHYRLDFDLNNPSMCCGVGASGVVDGRFDFDKGTLTANTTVPQYWVAEWTVDVVNPGTNYYLNFDARLGPWSLLPSSNPTSGRYTGSFNGSGSLPWLDNFCFGSLDQCSRSFWTFTAGGGIDGGGTRGLASLNIDIAFAFSDTPFTQIIHSNPTTTPTAVSEPDPLALLGAGIGLLAFVRPRHSKRK